MPVSKLDTYSPVRVLVVSVLVAGLDIRLRKLATTNTNVVVFIDSYPYWLYRLERRVLLIVVFGAICELDPFLLESP
jgi:hypothetical protein